jgi:cell division protease FtsH
MRALLVGEDKPGLEDAMEERRVTAAHEAGHAVATLLCQPQNRLARVSVMPSSKGAAGYSMSVPPERLFQTRQDLEAHVLVALAGRAGEELIFGPEKVTTGAANDLQKATELITRMYLEWGMDEATGPLARGALAKAAPLGESEVRAMAAKMQALYVRALALLRAHEGALRAVAGALVAHETLTGQEVAALLDENCRTNPTQNA